VKTGQDETAPFPVNLAIILFANGSAGVFLDHVSYGRVAHVALLSRQGLPRGLKQAGSPSGSSFAEIAPSQPVTGDRLPTKFHQEI
jgi:hypothetical protein